MSRQTPAPTHAISTLYPQVEPLPRTTVRLHPRPATGDGRHSGIYQSILQIRQSDVPELPFPAESDLFQMIWCSRLHMPDMQPRVRVAWRTERTLTHLRTEFPAPLSDEAHLGPHNDDL